MSTDAYDVNAPAPDVTGLPDLEIPPPVVALPWLLHAYGHSMVQGGEDSWGAQFPNRFSSRLASRLRAKEFNYAHGASVLVTDNGPLREGAAWAPQGGWVTFLQNAVPEARTRMPLLCPQQLVIVMNGHLEIGIAGPERAPELYPGVLRTVLRRLRAGALYEDDHESVRVLGPHERVEGTWRNSGSGCTILTADRSTVDITVPDWYPGGHAIDVGGVYVDGAAADVIITLDGKELDTYEVTKLPTATVGHEHPEHTPWSYRIDGALLGPGKHAIRLEYVNVRGWGSFDYWQIEAAQAPLVLMPEVARFPGSWDYAPVKTNFNVSEEDRAAIDAWQRAVAREFTDGNVVPVPIQDLLPFEEAVFTEDDMHPNALGADRIAERLYDVVVARWTRAHALGTGTAVPRPRSQKEIRIQQVRSKVGLIRRRLMP